MYNNVPPQLWMQVDKEVRNVLVEHFDIKMTGVREIRDQEIISDGYSAQDLRAITLEKMVEYIGSEETFPRAWEITCSKAKGVLYPPISMNEPIQMADEPKEEEIIKTNIKTNDSKKNK